MSGNVTLSLEGMIKMLKEIWQAKLFKSNNGTQWNQFISLVKNQRVLIHLYFFFYISNNSCL